ncbi:hypothetical protein ACWGQ4_14200 [Streptomyces sp. NPDC055721]
MDRLVRRRTQAIEFAWTVESGRAPLAENTGTFFTGPSIGCPQRSQ